VIVKFPRATWSMMRRLFKFLRLLHSRASIHVSPHAQPKPRFANFPRTSTRQIERPSTLSRSPPTPPPKPAGAISEQHSLGPTVLLPRWNAFARRPPRGLRDSFNSASCCLNRSGINEEASDFGDSSDRSEPRLHSAGMDRHARIIETDPRASLAEAIAMLRSTQPHRLSINITSVRIRSAVAPAHAFGPRFGKIGSDLRAVRKARSRDVPGYRLHLMSVDEIRCRRVRRVAMIV